MKILNLEQKSEAWHEARLGRVTGTGLKRILGTPKVRESYFYEILAERLSTEANSEESALDRGVRLENEAITAYEAQKGVKVERIGFIERNDCKWIGSSPDGLIATDGIYKKGVEVKCLSSANHIKTYLTQEIPEEYTAQGINYFVVNDDCEEVDFVFYDPRISKIPMFVITMKRSEHEKEIVEALEKVRQFIKEVDEVVIKII
jgi:putative phage-type endonuclease